MMPSDDQNPESFQDKQPALIQRLSAAFGPLIGAIILDVVDLASIGPLGIGGFVVGVLVGWWILSVYELSSNTRVWLSFLAGVYCLIPFTEFVPVAPVFDTPYKFLRKCLI